VELGPKVRLLGLGVPHLCPNELSRRVTGSHQVATKVRVNALLAGEQQVIERAFRNPAYRADHSSLSL